MPQATTDIRDNKRDQERLQPEETTLDLPEVKDIPGQEHIRVPRMKEFQDTTIASDDEEGKRVFEDAEPDEATDVSEEERELLQRSADSMSTEDDEDRRKLLLDNTDSDGDPLNERVEASGNDLDIPGAEDDDANESLGEEDEENNGYSLGGDRKD
ncbi:hypothetical protein [Sediminibacterium soli]|uniref:hypothetical protein n=1 Tax=Sediminibacterium soli TaxID=2698829 RepID=UPI00192A1B24|nr:hypothetical protein [Sediminibacterium soli]NCI46162.1 hypothetical protein [Sediminibacterium soli]